MKKSRKAHNIKTYPNGQYAIQYTAVPGTATCSEDHDKTSHLFRTLLGVEYKPTIPWTLYRYRSRTDADTIARAMLRMHPQFTSYKVVLVSELPWMFVWDQSAHAWVDPNIAHKTQDNEQDNEPDYYFIAASAEIDRQHSERFHI